MSAARKSTLIAVQDVRKDAALVVELCDAAVIKAAIELLLEQEHETGVLGPGLTE